jgi:DNA-3-methyladenine glycosylase
VRLGRDFYARPTLEVARDLLGCLLVHRVRGGERVGRIVEVEAYVGEHDRACHAHRGRTRRTEPMYGPPGHAYVYLVYGMHHLLNLVTEREGFPAAVLLRALEPVAGLATSASGPGRLGRAMGIDLSANRADLTHDRLFVREGERPARVARSPRIGVAYAGEWAKKPWRLFVAGHPAVSGPRRSGPDPL